MEGWAVFKCIIATLGDQYATTHSQHKMEQLSVAHWDLAVMLVCQHAPVTLAEQAQYGWMG